MSLVTENTKVDLYDDGNGMTECSGDDSEVETKREATPQQDRQANFLQGGYRIPRTKDSWQANRKQARERIEARRERRHTSEGDKEGSGSRERKWAPKMRVVTGRGYRPERESPSKARRESSEERRLNDQEPEETSGLRRSKWRNAGDNH